MLHLLDLLNRRFDLGLSDEIRFLHVLSMIDPNEWPAVPVANDET